MTDTSTGPEHVQASTGLTCGPETRQLLLTLFSTELARVGADALANGTPSEGLIEQIEERVARLRQQVDM